MPAQTLPGDTAPLLDLAEQKIGAGQHKAALALLLPALQRGASDLRSLSLAAGCYWALDDAETAMALIRLGIEAAPENAMAWGKLGAMALYVGEREVARAAYEQSVRLNPRSASALAALNRLAPLDRGGRHVRLLREMVKDRKLPARERMLAANALGRVEEAAGNFGPAFHHFTRSNKLAAGRYDPAALERKLDDQRRLFDPAQLPPVAPAKDAPRLVFITGLPRSGTTLTESILARHPQVRSVGESLALTETMLWLRRAHGGAGAWDFLQAMTPELAAKARQVFLARIGAKPGDGVIVDKMPMDCLDLGLVRLILPEARIVFMSRHPLDVGLSNFVTAFDRGNGFSTRLDWMGHITRIVRDSIADYVPKLGDCLRLQSYRALVERPEAQIRDLLDHAGLPWDPACLAPEAAGGAVRTASVLQVRERINTRGLDKWRAYEAQLAPLVAALGGAEQIAEWEAADAALSGG